MTYDRSMVVGCGDFSVGVGSILGQHIKGRKDENHRHRHHCRARRFRRCIGKLAHHELPRLRRLYGRGYPLQQQPRFQLSFRLAFTNITVGEHRWGVYSQERTSFCVQLFEGVTVGNSYTFNVVDPSQVPEAELPYNAPGPMGSVKAQLINDLYRRYYAGLSNAADKGAFQLAIYEISHENISALTAASAVSQLALDRGAFQANKPGGRLRRGGSDACFARTGRLRNDGKQSPWSDQPCGTGPASGCAHRRPRGARWVWSPRTRPHASPYEVIQGAAQETFIIIEAVADPNGDRFILNALLW